MTYRRVEEDSTRCNDTIFLCRSAFMMATSRRTDTVRSLLRMSSLFITLTATSAPVGSWTATLTLRRGVHDRPVQPTRPGATKTAGKERRPQCRVS